VSGEIGVGGGIIAGGELLRGARGFGGELGHVTMDPEGPPCRCGSRGCLEQFVGLEALLRAAGLGGASAAADATPAAVLAEPRARGRCRDARRARGRRARLGIAAASVANLIDPAAIVLGGYFAPLTALAREPIVTQMRARVIAAPWAPPVLLAPRWGVKVPCAARPGRPSAPCSTIPRSCQSRQIPNTGRQSKFELDAGSSSDTCFSLAGHISLVKPPSLAEGCVTKDPVREGAACA
jgi:predicted NBD/HSP70 family sugar kinase